MAITHTDSSWAWVRRGAAAVALTVFAVASGCGSGSDKAIPSALCSRCGASELTSDECEAIGKRVGCEVASTATDVCGGAKVTGCVFENCDEPPDCSE